jgi:anti-sigma B factor antagonist
LLNCAAKKQGIFVDLSAVQYIDSSGVASLVEAFQTCKKQGTKFALVAVNPSALRVLELARLDKIFTIYETLDAGLRDRS